MTLDGISSSEIACRVVLSAEHDQTACMWKLIVLYTLRKIMHGLEGQYTDY